MPLGPFSAYPLREGNTVPKEAVFRHTRVSRAVAIGDATSANVGSASIVFHADKPAGHFSYQSTVSGNWVGEDSVTPFNTANPDVSSAFTEYDQFVTIRNEIRLHISPIVPPPGLESQALAADTKYATDTQWWLTLYSELGNATPPHGSTDAGIRLAAAGEPIARIPLTTTGVTSTTSGGTPRACELRGVYEPKRTYSIRDIRDNIDLFDFFTGGSATYNPNITPYASFWQLTGAARGYNPDGASGATSVIEGRIYPHRVVIEMTSYLFCIRNKAEIDFTSAPVSGGSMFTAANLADFAGTMATATGMFGVAAGPALWLGGDPEDDRQMRRRIDPDEL